VSPPPCDAATTWLPGAQRVHTRAATAIVACACALAVSPPGMATQAAILLAGVALVGMPHGSFDHMVAERPLRARLGRWWWAPFGAGYLAMASLVWVGWTAAPATALTLFLAVSVLHFGLGDAERETDGLARRAGDVLARGGLPVLLPMALNPATVEPLVAALAGSDAAAASVLAQARWMLLPWAGCFAWWAARAPAAQRREALALCAAFAVLPPLLAFALYFCVCHSVRHLLRLGAMLAPGDPREAWSRGLRVGVPAAIVCLLGAAAFAAEGAELELARMFRLLAALTLPHMAVTQLLEQREQRPP
jgi:Brp/Blh family beta-carotene 15,15'-monooxygenase